MKTKLGSWLSVAVVAALISVSAFWVEAQQNSSKQTTKEQRQTMTAERRAQRIKERDAKTAAYVKHIDSIVMSHNFVLLTNPAFEVGYYSDYIDVYIPFIKGIVPPYYPTVFNYILTSVSNYTTVQNDGGWTVTFDSWLYSGNDYTFKLDIYSSSGTAILNIPSMAYNTVTYSGYITQVY